MIASSWQRLTTRAAWRQIAALLVDVPGAVSFERGYKLGFDKGTLFTLSFEVDLRRVWLGLLFQISPAASQMYTLKPRTGVMSTGPFKGQPVKQLDRQQHNSSHFSRHATLAASCGLHLACDKRSLPGAFV